MISTIICSVVGAAKEEEKYQEYVSACNLVEQIPAKRRTIIHSEPLKDSGTNPFYVLLAFVFGLSL